MDEAYDVLYSQNESSLHSYLYTSFFLEKKYPVIVKLLGVL